MITVLHAEQQGVTRGAPVDALARALLAFQHSQPDTNLTGLSDKIGLYWDANLEEGSIHVRRNPPDGSTEILKIGARTAGTLVWLPVRCVARLKPHDHPGWALGITANGTVRIVSGHEGAVSAAARTASQEDAIGTGEALAWLDEGSTDAPSRFLCARLTGALPDGTLLEDTGHAPTSPESLMRCLAFLEAVPTTRERLDGMAEASPHWARLIKRWEDLEILLRNERARGVFPSKTHDLLREIESPTSDGSPAEASSV